HHLLGLDARQAVFHEVELGLVGQRPVENTALNLVGYLADGDVRHAQARLALGCLLLDEVVGEALAELVEAGELSNLLREPEAIRREPRASWVIKIDEQDEPLGSIE